MADPELVRILKEEGVEAWNEFAEEQEDGWSADLSGADLSGFDLSGAFLSHASFAHSKLARADLSNTHLLEADLRDANLPGVDLRRADLGGASLCRANLSFAALSEAILTDLDLTDADLTDADLSGATLHIVNLHDASLLRADFTECALSYVLFGRVDISRTSGLASTVPIAGSTVGADTLSMSRGHIPEVFLKGCGFADWEIEQAKLYNPDLTDEEFIEIQYEVFRLKREGPIQINPIFLSYAHGDAGTVEKLHDTLQEDGIRCWRDKHELTAGPIEHQVDRAMRVNPTVVLVLSEASVGSDWVRWEAEHARKLEREQPRDKRRRVLCPIALDNAWKDCNWPAKLRTQIEDLYVIPFHELGFDEGYARLKKGLPIYYSGKKPDS